MKIKLPFILLIIISSFLLQNCKRKDPCENYSKTPERYYHLIPDSELVKIPFTGKDTLVYIGSNGDTSTLIGKGMYDQSEIIIGGNTVHCYQDIKSYYQRNAYRFIGNDSIYNLEYQIYNYAYEKDRILIYFKFNDAENGGNSSYWNNVRNYNDSILINGKFYNGVKETASDIEFLFNYQYGFIQIKFTGCQIWTRKF